MVSHKSVPWGKQHTTQVQDIVCSVYWLTYLPAGSHARDYVYCSLVEATKLMLQIRHFHVLYSKPVGKIQGLFKHFQRPYLFSSTLGLEFLKLNSSTFKNFTSTLWTVFNELLSQLLIHSCRKQWNLNCCNSHATKNETVFIGEVVANQVIEAEDADFEDGVVSTETQVHDCQDAHKLHITMKCCHTNSMWENRI